MSRIIFLSIWSWKLLSNVEYRPTFVSGRVGSMIDVFIDSIGVFMAVGIIAFSFFITKKSMKLESEEESE